MGTLRPVFTLTVGSFRCDESRAAGGPQSITVAREMNMTADLAEILMMDRSGINVDDPVVIDLGHDDQRQTVFTGDVIAVKATLQGIWVRALGRMQRLSNLRSASFYENQSAGAIVRDLADQADLSPGTVDDGPTLPRFAVDRRVSVYRHLRALAERLCFELYTDRSGKLMFHGLGKAGGLDAGGGLLGSLASAAAAALGIGGSAEGYEYGKNLLAATAHRHSASVESVEVGGESPMSSQGDTTSYWLSGAERQNHGDAGSGSRSILIMDPAARTQDLADRFAAGYLATHNRRNYFIDATVLGRSTVDLGASIQISGTRDDLISARGYVRAIRHRFGAEPGFTTTVRISVEDA